jgi:hypothetical protein
MYYNREKSVNTGSMTFISLNRQQRLFSGLFLN